MWNKNKLQLGAQNFEAIPIYQLDKIKFHIHIHIFKEILFNNDNTSIYLFATSLIIILIINIYIYQ